MKDVQIKQIWDVLNVLMDMYRFRKEIHMYIVQKK